MKKAVTYVLEPNDPAWYTEITEALVELSSSWILLATNDELAAFNRMTRNGKFRESDVTRVMSMARRIECSVLEKVRTGNFNQSYVDAKRCAATNLGVVLSRFLDWFENEKARQQ